MHSVTDPVFSAESGEKMRLYCSKSIYLVVFGGLQHQMHHASTEPDKHLFSASDAQQEISKLLTFANNNSTFRVQMAMNDDRNLKQNRVLNQAQLPPAKFQRKSRTLLAAQSRPPREPIENETYLETSTEIEFSEDTLSQEIETPLHLQMSNAASDDYYDSVLLVLMDPTAFREI